MMSSTGKYVVVVQDIDGVYFLHNYGVSWVTTSAIKAWTTLVM